MKSIVPLLVLRQVGETIANKSGPKLLVLNGHNDRETFGMTAIHFINAITNALNRGELHNDPQKCIMN